MIVAVAVPNAIRCRGCAEWLCRMLCRGCAENYRMLFPVSSQFVFGCLYEEYGQELRVYERGGASLVFAFTVFPVETLEEMFPKIAIATPETTIGC